MDRCADLANNTCTEKFTDPEGTYSYLQFTYKLLASLSFSDKKFTHLVSDNIGQRFFFFRSSHGFRSCMAGLIDSKNATSRQGQLDQLSPGLILNWTAGNIL